MKVRFLPFLMLPILGMAQANSNGEVPLGGNTSSERQTLEIKRNASFNLEEIKVRWKKAALENCQGAPCSAITAPGAPTGVVATVGNSVSVSFVAPTNNGGRAITGYTVTSNPGNITASGTTSPIIVTGLTNGASYTFTVIATNEVGNSVSSSTSTAVKSFTCGTGTISDNDGNPYETVLIGTQCWTKQNLKVTKYNDGSNIPEIPGSGTWDNTIVTGARTVYADLPSNLSTYGYLYNWYSATDSRKICPTGWHVPTDGEWTTLIQFIDPMANASTTGPQSTTAGGNLKSISTLWNTATPPSPGTDNYGFSALPGGFRYLDGSFQDIRNISFFWSTTDYPSNDAWNRNLNFGSSDVNKYNYLKSLGGSIRCLKD